LRRGAFFLKCLLDVGGIVVLLEVLF
jgi:hypothetical protein